MVVFTEKHFYPDLCAGDVPGTLYGMSDSGWIDQELFSDSGHVYIAFSKAYSISEVSDVKLLIFIIFIYLLCIYYVY